MWGLAISPECLKKMTNEPFCLFPFVHLVGREEAWNWLVAELLNYLLGGAWKPVGKEGKDFQWEGHLLGGLGILGAGLTLQGTLPTPTPLCNPDGLNKEMREGQIFFFFLNLSFPVDLV